MTQVIDGERLAALREAMLGPVIVPGDPDYERVRLPWSGSFYDISRPSVIARPMGVADVQDAVRFARENDLTIAVRGGGHSISGSSSITGGILIDMGLMRGVHVDPESRTALVDAGTLWSEFDRETQVHGLASTGGMISHTGIGGLTLGGGVGRFMRKAGLTCDNVLGFDVVTADSEWLHVDADNHPDLYWALRGGGGDFAIVTHFEFKLHPLGPIVYGGHLGWHVEDAKEVLSALREDIDNAPEELELQFLMITKMDPAMVPEGLDIDGGMLLLTTTWMGLDLEEGRRALKPFQEKFPPLLDLLGDVPYARLQAANDGFATPGRRTCSRTGFFDALTDEFIDVALEQVASLPDVMGIIELYQMGGAIARVPAEATPAYTFRKAGWFYVTGSNWLDEADDEKWNNWSRKASEALSGFRIPGLYLNFVGEPEDEDVLDALGDETFTRLTEIKAKYDPDAVFSRNPNRVTAAIPV